MQGAAFAPNHLPNLKLWLDAADVATITESSGSVSQWDDKSGRENHAVQTTGSNQPVTASDVINGKNVISFDGSNTQLDVQDNDGLYAVANGDNTLFVVAQADASFTGSGRLITFAESGGTRLDMRYETAASLVRYQSRNAFGSDITRSEALSNVLISMGYRNGSTQAISVNRDAEVSNSNASDENGINAVSIGARSLGDFFFGGVAEIVVYSRALSVDEYDRVLCYLAAKWGVSLV